MGTAPKITARLRGNMKRIIASIIFAVLFGLSASAQANPQGAPDPPRPVVQPTQQPAPAPQPVQSPPLPRDGKVRLYVTDDPLFETTAFHHSSSGAYANAYNAGGASQSGGFEQNPNGKADPRTVELQADLMKSCPQFTITSNFQNADYVLWFRRNDHHRTKMLLLLGVTGALISAAQKVDGASVFTANGDMVYATRESTVGSTVKDVCKHITNPTAQWQAEVTGYGNGDIKPNAAGISHVAETTAPTATANSTAGLSPTTNDSLSAAQSPAPTSQAQPSSVPSIVTVNSTPPGADILVDNDFAGDTPSTLNISAGKHIVRVKKPGFQEWVRSVNLYGGSVTLNAELAHSTDEIHAATTAAVDGSKESVTSGASTNSPQKSMGWIGVNAQTKGDAAVVTSVAAGGPAAQAGIQVGDIILALDGRLIKGKNFETEVAALKPGTQISVNYAHGTSAHEVSITIGSHNM